VIAQVTKQSEEAVCGRESNGGWTRSAKTSSVSRTAADDAADLRNGKTPHPDRPGEAFKDAQDGGSGERPGSGEEPRVHRIECEGQAMQDGLCGFHARIGRWEEGPSVGGRTHQQR